MGIMITIQFAVPAGYLNGDYARLCGNGGSGDIDWNNPLTEEIFDLFPRGCGIYGFGHAPWGHFRFGHGYSTSTQGFGHLPWGNFPFGYGTALITATCQVEGCGTYKFGFACYDKLGNVHEGTPEEVTQAIHVAPAAPITGLKKNSYNKTTDVLILDEAA